MKLGFISKLTVATLVGSIPFAFPQWSGMLAEAYVLLDPSKPAFYASEEVVSGPSGTYGQYTFTNNTTDLYVLGFGITNPMAVDAGLGNISLPIEDPLGPHMSVGEWIYGSGRPYIMENDLPVPLEGDWLGIVISNEDAWNNSLTSWYIETYSEAFGIDFPGNIAIYGTTYDFDTGLEPTLPAGSYKGFLFQPALMASELIVFAQDATGSVMTYSGPVTAAPEPATLGLIGLGLAAAFYARRKRA